MCQFAFNAADATQLSCAPGENVTVVMKGDNGWWRIRKDNGQEVRRLLATPDEAFVLSCGSPLGSA